MKVKSPRIFPGWWIVLTGAFMMFWVPGFYTYGFSALFKPIAAELNFSRAVTAIPSGLGRAEGGLEAAISGYLTDRFGPRWVILFGVFLGGLGLFLMYFIQSLWAYIVAWGVLFATGYNIASGVPMATAVANWFVKRRGVALSIIMASAALGGVVLLPFIAWLITTVGWRMTCVIGALVMWGVGIPLVVIFVKDRRPEFYGLLPDGATVKAADTSDTIDTGVKYASQLGEVEFTLRQAIGRLVLWILMLANAVGGLAFLGSYTHAVPLMTDLGVDPVKAAGLVGLTVIGGIPARLGGGFIADLFRKEHLRFALAAGYIVQAIGFVLFLLNPTIPMAVVLLVFLVIGSGITFGIYTPLLGRYFGRKGYGSIYGIATTFAAPFVFLVPIYMGWVHDSTGSYVGAFAVIAGLVVFTAVAVVFAVPPKPPAKVGDIRKLI